MRNYVKSRDFIFLWRFFIVLTRTWRSSERIPFGNICREIFVAWTRVVRMIAESAGESGETCFRSRHPVHARRFYSPAGLDFLRRPSAPYHEVGEERASALNRAGYGFYLLASSRFAFAADRGKIEPRLRPGEGDGRWATLEGECPDWPWPWVFLLLCTLLARTRCTGPSSARRPNDGRNLPRPTR